MKFIAFYDDGWFDSTTDFRMWNHLCRAYGIELQMVKEWSEADVGDKSVYLVDQEGTESLASHEIDHDGVYVFGRTHLNLLKLGITHQASVVIASPQPISLFSISAGSIVAVRAWP